MTWYQFVLYCLARRALRMVLMFENVLPNTLMSRFLQYIPHSGPSLGHTKITKVVFMKP